MIKKWTAAFLLLVLAMNFCSCGKQPEVLSPEPGNTGHTTPEPIPVVYTHSVLDAQYPQYAPMPDMDDYMHNGTLDDEAYDDAYDAWLEDLQKRTSKAGTYNAKLYGYFTAMAAELMGKTEQKNLTCSPENIYMALAMLAECTDGKSREQLLSLLDAKDLNELRETASAMWNVNYSDDGMLTTILGSSLWMNESVNFSKETVAALAEFYYASSFCGSMTDTSFFEDFRKWLNDQTGGLLKDQIDALQPFSPDDIVVLATTVYFKGAWSTEFSESATEERTFHTGSDKIRVPFMTRTMFSEVIFGDGYAAIRLPFDGGAAMWIILPDNGVMPSELYADGRVTDLLLGDDMEYPDTYEVTLRLPKFDITSDMDLTLPLQELGIHDVFSAADADFTPLTALDGIFVSSVKHAARVKIDEKGCEAAAFTIILGEGAAMPPEYPKYEFNADRPFAFVITGLDGLPLFMGSVYDPRG